MTPSSPDARPRQIHLGLFHLPLGRHSYAWQRPGAEGHPEDAAWAIRVARKLEQGLFDIFFLADSLVGPVPGEQGIGCGLEPLTLLGALAVSTSRIGLVATLSTSFSEPFNVARMFASLDHISGGRIGWNVVTSLSDRAAQNFGVDKLPGHADRYARAGEYMEVVKGLWDGWEEGALAMDRARGLVVDRALVHDLDHAGRFYSVRGPLNVSRPPQGHPVIVQAGSSSDGIGLAALHADVVFTAQDAIEDALRFRAVLRVAVAEQRPGAAEPLVLPGVMPIVGRTRAEAEAKFAELQANTDIAAGVRQLSVRWGCDLSKHDLDGPVPEPGPEVHGLSRVQLLLKKARAENYTLRELAAFAISSYGHRIIVGSVTEVADDLERWFRSGAADGFNIIPATMPDSLDDFVDLLVPELQRRGLFRTAYEASTLRGHLGIAWPARSGRD